jgi:hypothetical protein
VRAGDLGRFFQEFDASVGFGFVGLDEEAIENGGPAVQLFEFSAERPAGPLIVAVERDGFAKVGDGPFGAAEFFRQQSAATLQEGRPFGRGKWHLESTIEEFENAIRLSELIGKPQRLLESVTMLRVGFENPFEMLECFEWLVAALCVKTGEPQSQADDFLFRRIGQAFFEQFRERIGFADLFIEIDQRTFDLAIVRRLSEGRAIGRGGGVGSSSARLTRTKSDTPW